MQWLIDLIKDWVNAQDFLKTGFVDRGDPDTSDFTLADFVRDNAWHDLDLSSIVPDGAKAVALTVLINVTETSKIFALRKKGNSNVINISQMWNPVANLPFTADLIVACDSNRIVEYHTNTNTWIDIDVTVKGWWL